MKSSVLKEHTKFMHLKVFEVYRFKYLSKDKFSVSSALLKTAKGLH